MKPLPPALEHSAGLHGATAFTTLRTHWGEPLHAKAHLARLSDTCTFLDLPAPEGDWPRLETWRWGLLRLTVAAEGTFWSHRPLQPGRRPEEGVRVHLTSGQVHPQLAGHKTGNYLPYLLAGREAARARAFEGWLTDSAGRLVDGGRTSPLLEVGGRLIVPQGGLPGITRAAFLAGRPFEQRSVAVEELLHLTRAWICGSGVGVVPVREISGPGGKLTLTARWPDPVDPALGWPEEPRSAGGEVSPTAR
ncbi:aminotransferase class IV [Deinococcus hopiensis]|uniref:4-amino-4-deoxychorismate lyase n=1 Tax=Deinococcus hopiensis KR-140 TaxID=695939 RepID=A0A1W1VM38_9DEIO|nr:aminotransferase class IV [Deinococcus hopiensis]SMB94432.1 4-amino-4-deoxychorismate lyase [Deinococcus hopiensis KR-140]